MKRLNLIPRQAEKGQPSLSGKATFLRTPTFKALLVILTFLAIGISAQFLYSQQFKWKINIAKKELQAVKTNLSRLQSQQLNLAKEHQDLVKKKLLVDARLEYLKMAGAAKSEGLSDVLAYLPMLMPDEIWINKLSISREQMVIAGSTLDNQLVSELMDNLNKSKRFKESSFQFTQKSKVGDMTLYNFEIITHPLFKGE